MKCRQIIFALAVLCGFAACDKVDSQRDAMVSGDRKVKEGAWRDAIRSYEEALDGSAKTADVHYKIAVLYDDKLKEPLDAIHHYERYLDMEPNGNHAKESKIARSDCEKRLQAKMSKEGFMTTGEAARLRNENEALRKQLMDSRNPKTGTASRVPNPNAADPMPPGTHQYTVEPGDTLASIANKFYKNRAMSANIKDANFNQLNGKDIIRPGQVLIIPEAPKRKN